MNRLDRRNAREASRANVGVLGGQSVPIRIRRARASSNEYASNGEGRPDNLLALVDQGFVAGQRAIGQTEVMQVVWVYEHDIDFDGLKRFHHNFGYGLSGRLIERSPLPFGRHRWVLDRGPAAIHFADRARPRADLSDWADERSQVPVDPEAGPGWHLSVLPLTDGSTAVTWVVSHYIIDGVGGLVAVADAILGTNRDLGYPPPRSRTRLRALAQDLGQTARDAPEVARALVALAKLSRRQRRDVAPSSPAPRAVARRVDDGADPVIVPGIAIVVDLDQWDARAKSLGGTSTTLAAALAAKLGEHLGRRRASDGAVTLQIVLTDRTEGDTRALAVSFARVSLDPTGLTTDLRDARAGIKQALKALQSKPDESSQLAALSPFTPKRTWKRGVETQLNDPDMPVIFSNLGDAGSVVSCADGTQCEYAWARGTRQRATRQQLERTGGHMQVVSCRTPGIGTIYLTVVAYHPGAENTKPALRELAARALAEFGLTGEIE
ncbi:wax ester/triacylglycerol synthase family O-acyltransferase [Mycobacterium sp. UM_CSW]|uniref:wax ester/triacylglycerol synthase family O-acyltransferase n=1 Tax=Mycobacterium sp. UM_CSW TaxID=1370119 RepID=UPI001EF9DFC1|nr:wax ester/triacylglycerol synthase family O-acyltransferase [Mycobacterium sp. UM_CSW]